MSEPGSSYHQGVTNARSRIAIPTPTSGDLAYNRDCLPAYLSAIERSGGEAVVLTLGSARSEALQVVASCHGVVLPGSPADVGPERYGEVRADNTAQPDLPREEADTMLLEAAILRGLPVLGVCYGLQFVNVWRGGSLAQDLPVLPVHHAAGPSVAVAHTVSVFPESRLWQLHAASYPGGVAPEERIPVNSSHHQAIRQVGDGLRATAWCPQDGVVEALEGDSASLGFPLIAVQWHPERSFELSAISRELFRWLIDRAGR